MTNRGSHRRYPGDRGLQHRDRRALAEGTDDHQVCPVDPVPQTCLGLEARQLYAIFQFERGYRRMVNNPQRKSRLDVRSAPSKDV